MGMDESLREAIAEVLDRLEHSTLDDEGWSAVWSQ